MIGIVFGCFCPLHLGHLDLILKAKKENDLCVVVCCGYDNDRGKDNLSINKRYMYIKEYFYNDPLVKVIKINDTLLGIEEWKIDNWRIWLDNLNNQLEHLGLNNYKKKFYVSEEKYNTELTKFYNEEVVICRKENNISGTKIRNNPHKYWNMIAYPFKREFSHNILIMGTASEGKTTLVEDLGKYLNILYSHEVGRKSVIFKSDEELDSKDFVSILYEQNKLNESLINSKNNNGIFISDTDNLTTLMYAKNYGENDNFKLSMEDYNEILLPLAKMYAKDIKWNKIYVLIPHKKFVNDGIRCMVNSSYEKRIEMYNELINLLKKFNYKYEELDGNYYENFIKVKKYCEKILRGRYE